MQTELLIEKEMEEILTTEALSQIRGEAVQIPMAVAALGVIKTPEDFTRAAEAGISANRLLKQLEEMRKAAVKPWNDKVSRINSQFKYFTSFFDGYKEIIATRLKAYTDEQRRIAEAAQKKLDDETAKRQEKENAKAEKKGIAPVQLAPAPKIEAPAKTAHIAGVQGRVTNVKRPKYEILDEKAVSREFLMVDEKKLGAAVRARLITKENAPAWLKVWEEEEPTFV